MNDIPGKPKDPINIEQWDSRYAHFNDANSDLDCLMLAFFTACAERDIPVLAHCAAGEFQAASNYGELMAHPAFYRRILDTLEHRPKPLHLRLCLAHAGGTDFLFNSDCDGHREWGEQIYELCTHYPNVYCDVAAMGEITNGDNQVAFANQLAAHLALPGDRYDFGKKIVYGSDWFMPDAAGVEKDYLDGFQKVMLTQYLMPYYKDFFCLNALRFLGLDDPANPRLAILRPETLSHIVDLRAQAMGN